MSGSEPRLMPGRGGEPYGMALQNPSSSSSPSSVGGGAAMSNMCLTFTTDNAAVYKPVMPNSPSYHQHAMVPCSAAEGGAVDAPPPVEAQPSVDVNDTINSAEPIKRKRGRPRKYPIDGSVGLPSMPQPQQSMSSTGSGFSGAPVAPPPPLMSPPPGKRGRGRPPGSGRKQQAAAAASGPWGGGFTPHVITVKAGDDITTQILSFTQNGGRAVCIFSAIGALSNVTIGQSATSGGSVTYEGRFDIVSLSGSFMQSETGGQRSRTGGLRVAFAGPDGHVLGGCVAGVLTAASPIQVVVGSFVAEGHKDANSEVQPEPYFVAPPKLVPEMSSGGPRNHTNHQGFAACNNSNMPTMAWK